MSNILVNLSFQVEISGKSKTKRSFSDLIPKTTLDYFYSIQTFNLRKYSCGFSEIAHFVNNLTITSLLISVVDSLPYSWTLSLPM